jgi:hypothetical protein
MIERVREQNTTHMNDILLEWLVNERELRATNTSLLNWRPLAFQV